MSVTVRIPAVMRPLVGGRSEIPVEPGTVRHVLDVVGREAPRFRERILCQDGELRPHVNVFVNDEDVRFRDRMETPVHDGDRVAIVPAIAGGS